MSTENATINPLELDVYEQSQANIRQLKQTLPKDLVATLAREVIHRLATRDRKLVHIPHDPSPQELDALCHALISDDNAAATAIITSVRAEGTPAEVVYLKYLAASARLLGEWWLEDKASFVEVTVGTGRMFAIMRGMRHLFEPDFNTPHKSAVFASVPGEDHTLGVRMAADLFRKDGWDIALKVGLEHDDLIAEIERMPRSIIGLSIGGRHSVDALSKLVVALHICRPNDPLLVSGQDIHEIRPILNLMGLDGIAETLDEAKEQMASLWDVEMAGQTPD